MAKSNDVAVREDIEEQDYLPATVSDAADELARQNQEDTDANDFQIPLLKIGSGQTAEVQEDPTLMGQFINSLTGEGLGREVTFIVGAYQKGRFDHGDRKAGKRARKAYNAKNVPWNDDPFYGRAFTEHPDAEETYSKRVNNGDIEWGHGPRISTTFDFYGYVVDEDDPDYVIPVCLSLMRLNKKAAQKWVTILQAVLRGRFWDCTFQLSTEQQRGEQGSFYTVNVRQGRKTTPEEKANAVGIAQNVRNMNVEVVGNDDATAPKTEVVTDGADL